MQNAKTKRMYYIQLSIISTFFCLLLSNCGSSTQIEAENKSSSISNTLPKTDLYGSCYVKKVAEPFPTSGEALLWGCDADEALAIQAALIYCESPGLVARVRTSMWWLADLPQDQFESNKIIVGCQDYPQSFQASGKFSCCKVGPEVKNEFKMRVKNDTKTYNDSYRAGKLPGYITTDLYIIDQNSGKKVRIY